MFEQWDIVEFSFSPARGHEPLGRRPALVVSNRHYNIGTSLTLACPITTADNGFPLHFRLPSDLDTTGFVAVEQLRALDLVAREARRIERLQDQALRAAIAECVRSFV
ncbi:MAG: type II toxin-antitoxin system PemK/MazF family toxin [Bifidobacteriaceae bacterium]|jgi:mRNA interferase MazF|nr:type II toxin-antitoxin system PemK/MazF family toxin [Bifidobacteriaceae bacterium]